MPAAACAVAALNNALEDGVVKRDETVMLNITGAGMLNATSKGFEMKKPDLDSQHGSFRRRGDRQCRPAVLNRDISPGSGSKS